MRWLRQIGRHVGRMMVAGDKVHVHCMDNPNTRMLRESMQCLRQPYPVFMGGQHIETVWGTVCRHRPPITYAREHLAAHDGGTIALDWHVPSNVEVPHDAPVLVLIAGLTGGSNQSYIRYATLNASVRGYRVVCINHTGVAGSPVTSPRLYCAMYTQDLRDGLRHISSQYPQSHIHCAAWSIGANMLVHLLAAEGQQPSTGLSITAAVTLANPFDLCEGERNWKGPDAGMIRRAYDQYLTRRLRAVFQQHLDVLSRPAKHPDHPGRPEAGGRTPQPGQLNPWPTSVRPEQALTARTVRDFDDAATIHWFGFPDVDTYYRQASSCLVLDKVKTPMLCVQALDDPIAPAHVIPYQTFTTNPNLMLVTTPTGGHLGWVGGIGGLLGAPWTDKLMLDYLDAARELRVGKRS